MSLFPESASNGFTSPQLGSRIYPDPFQLYSTLQMPRTMEELLRWSEGIFIRNGAFSRAMKNVVRYFLTRIEVYDCSDAEKKHHEKFLTDTLNVINFAAIMGDDSMCYGNSFSSIYLPFKRMLVCHECSLERPIKDIEYTLDWPHIKWVCQCGHKNAVKKPKDRRTADEGQLKFVRWNPHYIKIHYHPISQERVYIWNPPPNIKAALREGDKFIVETMPWEMIEAVLNDKLFEFAPRVIHHIREEPLAGIDSGGWGIPPVLYSFHQAYYVQLGKFYNEILFLEGIVPFKVVSPKEATGGDPMTMGNKANFNNHVLRMWEEHRRNPGGLHATPTPIEYQVLGGEAMQINPYEHISQATEEMLTTAGVPAELWKGSLQWQAVPTALRLFEQSWTHLSASFNDWLDWIMETMASAFNWPRAKAKFQTPTMADDLDKRNILLQLMAGNRVSADTVLGPMGLSATDELKKIMDERRLQTEEENRFNSEQQQQQQLAAEFSQGGQGGQGGQGQQPAGGGDGSGGAQAGTTPEDLWNQAEQQAQALLAQPYEMRRTAMNQLKKTNQTLYSLVKTKMENIRSQAQSQGGYQALQTMVGGLGQQAPQ